MGRDRFSSMSMTFVIVLFVASFAMVCMHGCDGGRRLTSADSGGHTSSEVVDDRVLPKPEIASGERGVMGVDAHVNEQTIDAYLNMPNTRYVDVRMPDDPADWEAIGGDSRISGIVEGFEVVPFPLLVPTGDLPDAVGKGYDGPTLFVSDGDGGYAAAYNESMSVLCDLFPPDEDIVLMCGAGGYAGKTKELLVSLGWREDHIWVAGGWWYYEGSHGVEVAHDNGHGQRTWDFHKLLIHGIDFDVLHPVGSGPDEGTSDEAAELVKNLPRVSDADGFRKAVGSGDAVVYVYLPGCSACAEFAPVAAELAGTGQVSTYAVAYGDLPDASLRLLVGHAPGVIVFSGGEPVASLSADRDDDVPVYRSLETFTGWLSRYLDGVSVTRGEAVADIECGEGCEP